MWGHASDAHTQRLKGWGGLREAFCILMRSLERVEASAIHNILWLVRFQQPLGAHVYQRQASDLRLSF